MSKRPKSEAYAALHESMSDLHSVGAITDEEMREYDTACIVDTEDAAPTYHLLMDDDEIAWHWFKVIGGNFIRRSETGYRTQKECLADLRLAIANADPEFAA